MGDRPADGLQAPGPPIFTARATFGTSTPTSAVSCDRPSAFVGEMAFGALVGA